MAPLQLAIDKVAFVRLLGHFAIRKTTRDAGALDNALAPRYAVANLSSKDSDKDE